MADWVLISEAAESSIYSPQHIRYLIREGLVKGKKQGGIWFVDAQDLKRYEEEMEGLGTKKFDPTRGDLTA